MRRKDTLSELRSGDPLRVIDALYSLSSSRCRAANEAELEAAGKFIDSDDSDILQAALWAVGIRWAQASAFVRIGGLLCCEVTDDLVRQTAAEAVVRIAWAHPELGPDAIEALRQLSEDPSASQELRGLAVTGIRRVVGTA